MARKSKPSDKYWEERSIERTTAAERNSVDYFKMIQRTYRDTAKYMTSSIQRLYAAYYATTDKKFDIAALQSIAPRGSLAQLRSDMERLGLNTQLPEYYRGRINRLQLMNLQAWAEVKKAGLKEKALSHELYSKVVEDSYYRTIFDTAKKLGETPTFSTLDTKSVDKVLETKFYGKNYSERIWASTDRLAGELNKIIGKAVATGQPQAVTIREVQERFNVRASDAARLVRTEICYFENQSELESYRELGIDKYKFLATLDSRTSELCRNMDGKVFDTKDAKAGLNMPPLHPYCRSTITPYLGKEHEPEKRIMRDPTTGKHQVIDNITYSEWKQKYIVPAQQQGGGESVKVVIHAIDKVILTAAQKQAVEGYVSGERMYINQTLRKEGVEGLSDEDGRFFIDLRGATRNALGEDMVLYRAVDASAIFGEMTSMQYDTLESYLVYGDRQGLVAREAEMLLQYAKNRGKILEKGFMSTTKKSQIAFEWEDFTGSSRSVVLELKVPATAKGLDLGKHMPELDKHMGQHEVLLASSTEYKITNITAKDGKILVKAEVLPPPEVIQAQNKGIKDVMNMEQYAQYEKLLSAHKAEYELYNTYADKVWVADTKWPLNRRAHYDPKTNEIRFNLAKDLKPNGGDDAYRVIFHESGHNIDHVSNSMFSRKTFSLLYEDGLFVKTLHEESKGLVQMRHAEIKKTNPSAPIMNAYVSLKQEIAAAGIKRNGYLSDILSGTTRNKIQVSHYHPTKYWSDGGDAALATESFAQMYSATILNKEAAELIKKYLPKSYQVYCDMIKEMTKRGKHE